MYHFLLILKILKLFLPLSFPLDFFRLRYTTTVHVTIRAAKTKMEIPIANITLNSTVSWLILPEEVEFGDVL